jgi:hypothetical protein
MKPPESKKGYIEELTEFLTFLRNLWGILAGISVFFPLSNILLNVIPLGAYGTNDGVFDQLAPNLISTVTTVSTLFVVLVTFTGRHQFQDTRKRRAMLLKAWFSFGTGLFSLLAYLVLHQAYREYAWIPWGWGSGDPRKLLAEIPLLITYVLFFSLLTRAFMLLGMVEYFGKGKPHGRSNQPNA